MPDQYADRVAENFQEIESHAAESWKKQQLVKTCPQMLTLDGLQREIRLLHHKSCTAHSMSLQVEILLACCARRSSPPHHYHTTNNTIVSSAPSSTLSASSLHPLLLFRGGEAQRQLCPALPSPQNVNGLSLFHPNSAADRPLFFLHILALPCHSSTLPNHSRVRFAPFTPFIMPSMTKGNFMLLTHLHGTYACKGS
eukprot:1146847-Pelagomonas_calceolata.AAC.7